MTSPEYARAVEATLVGAQKLLREAPVAGNGQAEDAAGHEVAWDDPAATRWDPVGALRKVSKELSEGWDPLVLNRLDVVYEALYRLQLASPHALPEERWVGGKMQVRPGPRRDIAYIWLHMRWGWSKTFEVALQDWRGDHREVFPLTKAAAAKARATRTEALSA